MGCVPVYSSRNLIYSFLISDILLDLVFPFISSISISVTSSMICELVKFDPTILISTIQISKYSGGGISPY
ncbi:hypothetical protein ES704_00259 [subsurface metagenome]|jgi:hypothetical protein